MKTRNSTELKRRMTGRWLAAFHALAPALSEACERPGHNVTCPIEGKPQGFRLFRDADLTGGGVKQNDRAFPEGIDLLMSVNGWSFTQTYDEIEGWLDGRGSVTTGSLSPTISIEKKQEEESRTREWLRGMWSKGVPLSTKAAVSARVYLRSRGVCEIAESMSCLRFHPSLSFRNDEGKVMGHYPAILALVRNNEGNPVAIHRTFLRSTGVKLDLDGQPSRKMTRSIRQSSKGRVVRLGRPEVGVLGVAEGLETALSVTAATGIPVWSCLSAAMMTSFVPPPVVRHVMIFADKDVSGAGELAAERLQKSLRDKGIQSSIILPSLDLCPNAKGVDFADQWRQRRSAFADVADFYAKLIA